jgi:K+-transporting ATPase ATPase B chain
MNSICQWEAPIGFISAIALWLWFIVLFASFSEAVVEGHGKAHVGPLRRARRDIHAKKVHPNIKTFEC